MGAFIMTSEPMVLAAVERQPLCLSPTTTLAGFEAAGVGVSFVGMVQASPSFWLSMLVVADASA